MKRFLLTIIVILALAPMAHAQRRGPLTNVYASHFTVTNTLKTVTLPYNSRDVWIQNGSSVDVCVSPSGATIIESAVDSNCETETASYVFKMNGASEIPLSDYITDSITFYAIQGDASPVSVVVTY